MATDEVVNDVFGSVIEQLRQQSRKSQYLENPVMWAKDVLGVEPWSKQQDILMAVQEHDHVAVRSCHGSGKSYIASILACWWIAVHPEGEAIVVTTAPTFAQVHAILWEDIRKHHINAAQRYKEGLAPMKLPGYITQSDQWKSDSGVMMGFGRKPADNNDHGFQGIHRRYVLVIIDESCGIKENLFTAVEAITTTENSKILSIGNPDDPATAFNKFFNGTINPQTNRPVWQTIDVSSFDSPNFTRKHEGHYEGCDDPNCLGRQWAKRWDRDKTVSADTLPLLPNEEWVEQRRAAWGEESPLWASKVLGQFPLQSVNTLFSRETLNKGLNTQVKPHRSSKVVLGVDLAGFGPDYSTVYEYVEGPTLNETTGKYDGPVGGRVRLLASWGGRADEVRSEEDDEMASAARVHQLAISSGASEVRIDASGIGSPILARINMLSEGQYTIVKMRGDGVSPDNLQWVNPRAYWYEKAREKMFMGKIDIDPKDKKLEEELEAIQYHFKNRYHSLQIESKEEMEKRGLKSPDYADAAIYAIADVEDVNSPLARYQIGDRISMSTEDFLGIAQGAGFISPY